MKRDSSSPSPVAEAIQWVARITTIGLQMVLPGILGQWLDSKLGTSFLGITGFVLGVATGIWTLVLISRPKSPGGEDPHE